MQFPSKIEVVDPIQFEDTEIEGVLVRKAEIGSDLIIQVMRGASKLPPFAAQRVAKALVSTVGEAAMERVTVEMLNNDLIDGGSSVYIRCRGMNTGVIRSIMFPTFYQYFQETMLET